MARYAIANWKMNLPPQGMESYLGALNAAPAKGDVKTVVAPPFPYLKDAAAQRGSVAIAGQNGADQLSGAFTGEVSPKMLRDCGASYVLLGHSERRNLYHETDALIARKLALAIEQGLTPVLCIGEDLRVRDSGNVGAFLADQVKAAAVPALEQTEELVLAYEPIWAIGTGRNATGVMCGETCDEVRDAIRRFWPERHHRVPILYGGSVTPENVGDLSKNGRVDGFLVGGASLDSGRFLAIRAALE